MIPNMAIDRLNPIGAPTPRGTYSQISVTSSPNRLAFVSGQTGRRPDGSISTDIAQQTVDALSNIETLLKGFGATPRGIVHLRTYLVDTDALPAFANARSDVFASWFVQEMPPSNTLAIVAGLADPDAVVEIEAVAELPIDRSGHTFDNGRRPK